MADINKYFRKLISFEGGFVNNPKDRGKATNMGITLGTWKTMGYDKNHDGIIDFQDIELLTRDDVLAVLRKGFWDKWQADLINNQSIAEMLVDWTWASGKWGILWPQRLLGLKADGIVGNLSLASVNSISPSAFHANLLTTRISFVREICQRDPSQGIFLQGWLNRIQSFKYKS